MASYFDLEVSHVYLEVENNGKLLKFLNIDDLLALKQAREVYLRKNEAYLNILLLAIFNILRPK